MDDNVSASIFYLRVTQRRVTEQGLLAGVLLLIGGTLKHSFRRH